MSNPIIRVESVKFLSKKNNLFIVCLENKSNYKVHADFVLKYNIKKNHFVKNGDIAKASNQTEKQLIKDKIIVLLSYRQRSKKEIKNSLLSRGFNLNNINDVIDYMESKKYINDLKFAKMYATYLVKQKKLGQFVVEHKLKEHNIRQHTIEKILLKLYRKFPPANTIRNIIKKRIGTRYMTDFNKIKMTNYLKRKGFHHNDIISVIEPIYSIE